MAGSSSRIRPSEPRSAGPPTLCGRCRSQRPHGLRHAPAVAPRGLEDHGSRTRANEAAPSFPSAQQDADGSGGAYALPSQHVPSRMLQTPLCSKGGDLSSRWRPRELCDQSRMSACRTCKGRCAWRPGCSPGCRGRATASSERRAVRTSVGAAAATGVGRRLSAAWCGPCPSHALPADVYVFPRLPEVERWAQRVICACVNEVPTMQATMKRYLLGRPAARPRGDQLPDRADYPRRGGGRRPAAADVGVHAERGGGRRHREPAVPAGDAGGGPQGCAQSRSDLPTARVQIWRSG